MEKLDGVTYYTKEELVIGLKSVIARSNRRAIDALLTVYRNQTFEEQTVSETIEDNGIGFNGTENPTEPEIVFFKRKTGDSLLGEFKFDDSLLRPRK